MNKSKSKYNVVRISGSYGRPLSSERRLRSTSDGNMHFAYPNENTLSSPISITDATAYRINYPFGVVPALADSQPASKNQSKQIVRQFG